MSSKEQKKLYKDKNIRNRKERNDKRTMKNSMFCEDPFLTEGDYDKNINNKTKDVKTNNQDNIKNNLELENGNNKDSEGDNPVNNEECTEEEFDDSYFDPITYK